MDRQPIDELKLRAIVDFEVRSAMGEIGGELAEERSAAMDYYLGEPVGKLSNPSPDRSSIVITTVRDTVEWLLPQLMRIFAQADSVVEFEAVGPEDEESAKQETQAINHIFWRQNEGFLILLTWIQDALLQKNGIVKYWLDESEDYSKEEHDGLTDQALAKMLEDPDLEAVEHNISEIKSVDGQELHHVIFERKTKEKRISIELVPPEEFLISNDARSIDLATNPPRFQGHYTEKTLTEIREMGFSEDDIEAMKRGDERWDELDEEWIARYHLSDEQEISDRYAHESMRKIRLVEGYMKLDMDGDGYAEQLRIFRAGEFISYEEADHIPFASITPKVLSHKFFGLSVFDLVHDLQEIMTATTRNMLDNMYQVNNTRPVVNERVDIDSLLTSRPGAPIYIDDEMGVGDAIAPFAPPPMWKDGLGLLEYMDGVRKDRTGVGDETMGLDPSTLASANTGVVLQAMEAARAKVELIARIFAETGIKWLFRGIHELSRKGYDQALRYKLSGQYIEVNPQEWRKRTDITVNVGTATGNRQQDQFALQQIAQMQEKMVAGGLMGKTILPSNIYQTAKDLSDTLGKHGEKYFLDPMLLADPQVQQIVQMQLPPPGPDPQTIGIQAMAQAEQQKNQIAAQKLQVESQLREKELVLRHLEASGKEELATMKQQLEEQKLRVKESEISAKTSTERMRAQHEEAKAIAEIAAKQTDAEVKLREQDLKAGVAQLQGEVAILKATADLAAKGLSGEAIANRSAEIQSEMTDVQRIMSNLPDFVENLPNVVREIVNETTGGMPDKVGEIVGKSSINVAKVLERHGKAMEDMAKRTTATLDALPELISQSVGQAVREAAAKEKTVEYDDDGRIKSIR